MTNALDDICGKNFKELRATLCYSVVSYKSVVSLFMFFNTIIE